MLFQFSKYHAICCECFINALNFFWHEICIFIVTIDALYWNVVIWPRESKTFPLICFRPRCLSKRCMRPTCKISPKRIQRHIKSAFEDFLLHAIASVSIIMYIIFKLTYTHIDPCSIKLPLRMSVDFFRCKQYISYSFSRIFLSGIQLKIILFAQNKNADTEDVKLLWMQEIKIETFIHFPSTVHGISIMENKLWNDQTTISTLISFQLYLLVLFCYWMLMLVCWCCCSPRYSVKMRSRWRVDG